MSTLSDKIESCYKTLGKDRTNFAKEIGIPESTIRNWKRKDCVPASDVLFKISKYFNLPMEYFLDGSENPLSDKEISTILRLRKLTEEQFRIISYMIEKFESENEKSQEK